MVRGYRLDGVITNVPSLATIEEWLSEIPEALDIRVQCSPEQAQLVDRLASGCLSAQDREFIEQSSKWMIESLRRSVRRDEEDIGYHHI